MINTNGLIQKFVSYIKQVHQNSSFTPAYRLLEVQRDENESYLVRIQIINKNLGFYAKPEDILAIDSMVDMFSPRDIRTLTYLGYLGVNSPKYRILAQRIMDNGSMLFSIKQKNSEKIIVKTAAEIIQEHQIIAGMHAEDAKAVSYMAATESLQHEHKLKQQLKVEANMSNATR